MYPSFKTLSHIWSYASRNYTDFPCLGKTEGEAFSYRDVAIKIQHVQKWLKNHGVNPGSRVALYARNQPWWGITYLGITTMGAIAVPILADFHPNEVLNIIYHSEASLALISKSLEPQIQNYMDAESIVLERPLFLLENMVQEISALGNEDMGSSYEVTPDQVATIIYTSGTTGRSKGVMLTHLNIASNVTGALPLADIEPREVLISILPLSHAYECTLGFLTPLAAGACIRYLDKPATASVLLPVMAQFQPHLMLSVPLIMEKIYQSKIAPQINKNFLTQLLWNLPLVGGLLHKIAGAKLKKTFGGRLHFFGIGGSALAPAVEKFLRKAGFPYAIGYGLTETAPLIAGTGPQKTKYRSTGPALLGTEIRIGEKDPQTQVGEVLVRGPGIMKGYYKDEEKTKAAFTDDGWFKTGDLGSMDSRGYLTIHGRLKNVILGASGENIYPEDIEAVINQKPHVAESLVVKMGQELVAKVSINQDTFKDWLQHVADQTRDYKTAVVEYLQKIRNEINHHLNKFSRIHRLELQEEPFEKTPTLKIKRYLYK